MRVTLLAVALSLIFSVLPVSAQAVITAHYQLNIPQQPLDTALKDFARQTGLQVARFSDRVDGSAVVGPVIGSLSADDALKSMLGPKGLTYKMVNERTIAIVNTALNAQPSALSPQPSAPGSPESSVLSPQSSETQKEKSQKGDGFRVAQASPNSALSPQTATSSPQPSESTPVQQLEEVMVTGSRVATNGNASPTPLTLVTTDSLLAQTPSNLPNALNKLPQFETIRTGQDGSGTPDEVGTANTLNLRNFGPQRNLILFNGLRVPANTAAGAVDVNVLPQMLIQRVDIVTGGTSAVYGSDAVTGVVNFVVDKKFNGIKFDGQGGISSRADDRDWKVGIAAGTNLFCDDRAHVEFSYEHFDSKGIPSLDDRPNGPEFYTATGAGSPDNPFTLTKNGRASLYSNGGLITAGPASLVGQNFTQDGVLSPFVNGTPTGSYGLQSGGGGLVFGGTLYAPLKTDQAYGRSDYQFSDSLSAYVDAGFSQSVSRNAYLPFGPNGLPGLNAMSGAVIQSGNAFLPASVQSAMTAAGGGPFLLSRYQDVNSDIPGMDNVNKTQNWLATAAVEGTLFGDWKWNAGVRYGRSDQLVINANNINASRLSAALDAVTDPATGRIVCEVSLTASASLYPGCVPVNLFGPTAVTKAAVDYITNDTQQTLINEQIDYSTGISGDIFSTWAGPIRGALSGEYRVLHVEQLSDANPLTRANCTGLRANCAASTPAYFGYTQGAFAGEENVKEAAVEVLVPLLADVPFVRRLEFNGAARYTDYSTSGSVETWKVGLNWQVSDELRFRATRSRDIRAPTLYDLFQPSSESLSGFDDLHTGVTKTVTLRTQGNPNLVPEIGNTLTVGTVYQPHWLPGFSVSLDYYYITLSDAITDVLGASAATQALCEESGGASPYCALYVRPGPFSDHSPANTATVILNESLNVAKMSTKGADVEADYGINAMDGRFDVRLLASYQPQLLSQQTIGGQVQNEAGVDGVSQLKFNLNLGYTANTWGVLVSERWKSEQAAFVKQIASNIPNAPAYEYTDVTLEFRPKKIADNLTMFFTVENLFDKNPPVFGTIAGAPGLISSYAYGYDVVGRYFTAGIKAKF